MLWSNLAAVGVVSDHRSPNRMRASSTHQWVENQSAASRKNAETSLTSNTELANPPKVPWLSWRFSLSKPLKQETNSGTVMQNDMKQRTKVIVPFCQQSEVLPKWCDWLLQVRNICTHSVSLSKLRQKQRGESGAQKWRQKRNREGYGAKVIQSHEKSFQKLLEFDSVIWISVDIHSFITHQNTLCHNWACLKQQIYYESENCCSPKYFYCSKVLSFINEFLICWK